MIRVLELLVLQVGRTYNFKRADGEYLRGV